MEPNREELLRKLRQIREEIKNVNVLQKQAYAVIEKKESYKTKLSTDRFRDFTHPLYYTAVVAGLAISILAALTSAGGAALKFSLVWAAIYAFILYRKKDKPSSILRRIVEKLLIIRLCFCFLVPNTVQKWATIAAALALSYPLVKVWLKKTEHNVIDTNRQIVEDNEAIEEYNREIQGKFNEIQGKVRACADRAAAIGDGWFPEDYYFMDAVDFFIRAVSNHRADTVKEMINLYEEDQYRKRMQMELERIEAIEEQQQRQLQMLSYQMTFSNIMQMAKLNTLNDIQKDTAAMNERFDRWDKEMRW